MSENTTKPESVAVQGAASKFPISEEIARESVIELFAEFDAEHVDDDGDETASFRALVKAVRRGRLEIGEKDNEVTVVQKFKRPAAGKTETGWNWRKLGTGKAKVKLDGDGVGPYQQNYVVAVPMTGIERTEIESMHPVDLSLLEVIARFFINI